MPAKPKTPTAYRVHLRPDRGKDVWWDVTAFTQEEAVREAVSQYEMSRRVEVDEVLGVVKKRQ